MTPDPDLRPDLLTRLGGLIASRVVKLALAVLIVLSFLPLPEVQALWPVFIAAFGLELGVRLALLLRGPATDRLGLVFLLVDLAAFASFLPLQAWLGQELGFLVVLRLTRLLVLLRFARELARDVYAILTRREMMQQFGLVTGAVFMLAFVAAVMLAQLRVAHDYNGDGTRVVDFLEQLWWSFRQMESPDNLIPDLRAAGPVLAVLSVLLTIVGVFIISFVIGIGANVVDQVVRVERRRPVGYRGHSLVIGPVEESELLVREFVRLYGKNAILRRQRVRDLWARLKRDKPQARTLPRIALLGPGEHAPAYLYDPGMRWVVYRQGESAAPISLDRVGAAAAKRAIFVTPPSGGPDADAVTLAALAAFRDANPVAHAYVEVLESADVDLVQQVGGPGTFPLDMRRFLGLFLCHHLITPGVDALYRDLLTSEGAEFYAHVFVDEDEHAALARREPDGALSFAAMARAALRNHGVILTGVLLGRSPVRRRRFGLIPVDEITQWVNPRVGERPDSPVSALGARAGKVPVASLRGLMGVASTYLPLRGYAERLLAGHGALPEGGASAPDDLVAARTLAARSFCQERPLARVLIVGYSMALRSLVDGLARFVPGIQIEVVLGARGDETLSLDRRLRDLQVETRGAAAPDGAGAVTALPNGGQLTVHTHRGSDLAGFAVSRLAASGPVDAAVFLSEPDSSDRDARTALRVHRFARALASGAAPRGRALHLLAEFNSLERGRLLERNVEEHRCGFAAGDALRVTLVSTDQIRSYFMVHSAFVPGVTALYDRLIGDAGQDLIRLEVPADAAQHPVSFGALVEAFGDRGIIPLALGLHDGRVLLNPPAGERFGSQTIACVYAIGERREMATEVVPAEDMTVVETAEANAPS